MITGCAFTFIAWFMFFINNDQSQTGKWRKQRRSGTDHHLDFSLFRTFKLIIAFSLRLSGIDNWYFIPKSGIKSAYRLICQSNLRDQHDCFFSLRKRLLDQLYIHLGFPAPCHSLNQYRLRRWFFPLSLYLLYCCFLFICKRHSPFSGNITCIQWSSHYLIIFYADNPLLLKFLYNSRSCPQFFRRMCIIQSFFLQKFPQKSCSGFKPCLFKFFQQLRSRLFGNIQAYIFFLFCLDFLLDRKYCPESLDHGGTIIFSHPGCQGDQSGFRSLFSTAFFNLFGSNFRFIWQSDHISFTHPAGISKRDGCHHPCLYFLLQPFRYTILKTPVQFITGNINYYISIYHELIPVWPATYLPARISAIRTRSSIGYFFPLISW